MNGQDGPTLEHENNVAAANSYLLEEREALRTAVLLAVIREYTNINIRRKTTTETGIGSRTLLLDATTRKSTKYRRKKKKVRCDLPPTLCVTPAGAWKRKRERYPRYTERLCRPE